MKKLFIGLLLFLQASLGLNAQTFTQTFDNFFNQRLSLYQGNVVVLIGCGDNVLYTYERGAYNVNTSLKVQSLSKWVTAAIIMKLVEENKLTLNDKVGFHIPSWNVADKQNITIRQLLSHTSGIVAESPYDDDPGISLQQAVDNIAGIPLQFSPGSNFGYGSCAYKVASRIAEKVENALWKDIFAARIKTISGMPNAVYSPGNINNPATGRGIETSMTEYSNFMKMILKHGVHNGTNVLNSASVDSMEKRHNPVGQADNYGLGQFRDENGSGGVKENWHPGVSGCLTWVNREKNYYGIILSQAGFENVNVDNQAFRTLVQNTLTSTDCGSGSQCNINITASNTTTSSNLNLSASCTGTNCSGVTYAWTGPGGAIGSGSSLSITKPTSAGTYNYTVTASKSGCAQKTATTSYVVNPTSCGYVDKQTVGTWSGLNVQTRQYTVNGASTWLIVTAVNGSSTDKHFPRGKNFADRGDISWTNGVINKTCLGGGETGWSGLVIPSGITVPSGYSQNTEPDGAVYFQQTCTPPSAPTLSASPSTITTSGGSSTLTASGCSGGTINWSDGLGAGPSKSVTPSSTKTYTATCSIGGCTSSNGSVTVTVNTCTPPSAPSLSASPSTITTSGGSSTLTASGCSGTVNWSDGLGTGTSKSVTPSSTKTYTATCSIGSCTSGNGSVTVTVNISGGGVNCNTLNSDVNGANCLVIEGWIYDASNPNTPVNIDVYDGSTLIISNYPANKYRSDLSGMGNGYHAFEINTPSSLRDGQSHTLHFKASGCNYTLNNSPRILSGCSNVVVDMTGADGWADQKLNLVVSPNPNKGIFETSFYLEKGKKATIMVADMQGRTIYRQSVTGQGLHREKINLLNKASGTLLLQLQKEGGTEIKKINISR